MPKCKRQCAIRDRIGKRVRYRRRCYWHHRFGTANAAPEPKVGLTTGMQCEVKGCHRAPEAFRRPDGRVYARSRCRWHRGTMPAKTSAKPLQTPRQPAAPAVAVPVALTSTSKPWRELDIKWARKHFAITKKGIWVKDDRTGWFVPSEDVQRIIGSEDSTFDVAKRHGLPSRVVLNLIAELSKGRIQLT